jgi:hypothetical protein
MAFYWLILGVLGVWRVTLLFNAEDGPGGAFVRLRRAAGAGPLGDLLDCFNCLSLVIAAPFAAVIGAGWTDRGLLWPALSAGAIIVERILREREGLRAGFFEHQEETHELLREDASGGERTGEPR